MLHHLVARQELHFGVASKHFICDKLIQAGVTGTALFASSYCAAALQSVRLCGSLVLCVAPLALSVCRPSWFCCVFMRDPTVEEVGVMPYGTPAEALVTLLICVLDQVFSSHGMPVQVCFKRQGTFRLVHTLCLGNTLVLVATAYTPPPPAFDYVVP